MNVKVVKYVIVDGDSELEKRILNEVKNLEPSSYEFCKGDVCGEIYLIDDLPDNIKKMLEKVAGEVNYVYIPLSTFL